jgi:phage tail-like protein
MAAAERDRPHLNSNFLVEFGAGPGSGFAEVIFAPFTIGERAATHALPGAGATANRLVLRRGATGALDLYTWWDQARQGKAPARRVVKVKLLAEDHATVVMSWRFRNVRPLSLSYSPLQAMDGGVLMETLELAYDAVEMTAATAASDKR